MCLVAIGAPEPPDISAKSAIIVDAATGTIIYEKNSHEKRPPASTTKIMTAIIALEYGNPNDIVTASEHACETDNSSMHLKPGEKIKLDDLLYALMLRSANDAAVCIAEHIAGSEENFVKLMNEKATQIGAVDTHFVNPHGLHDDNHYTTAYDLALIARYAIQIPAFNKYVATKQIRINRSINTQDVTMRNTANFLWKYKGADGIKTGHTNKAGRCFVGSATRDGWRIVSVVLGSNNAGRDTTILMDYAFKYYKQVPIAIRNQMIVSAPLRYGEKNRLPALPAKDISLIVRKSESVQPTIEIKTSRRLSAPVVRGDVIGNLRAFYGGKEIGSCSLVAGESVPRTLIGSIIVWGKNILTILLIIIIGLYAYGTAIAKTARRRRHRIAKARRAADNIGPSEH